MFGLGTQELIIILVIIMVLFGASRLPELGSGIGKAIRNFKKSMNEDPKEIDVTPKKADAADAKAEAQKEDKKPGA